jgi:hypothetical protein
MLYHSWTAFASRSAGGSIATDASIVRDRDEVRSNVAHKTFSATSAAVGSFAHLAPSSSRVEDGLAERPTFSAGFTPRERDDQSTLVIVASNFAGSPFIRLKQHVDAWWHMRIGSGRASK